MFSKWLFVLFHNLNSAFIHGCCCAWNLKCLSEVHVVPICAPEWHYWKMVGTGAPRRSLGHYRYSWEVSWILTSFPAMRWGVWVFHGVLPHSRSTSNRLINHELDPLKPWANTSFLFKVGYFRHLLIITEGWQIQMTNSLFSPHPENRVCFLNGLNGNLWVKKKNKAKHS